MTASEIYDIVKDVPKEAWPKCVEFENDSQYGEGEVDHWTIDIGHYEFCPAEAVELLFIGSLTNYLIGEGYHDWHWDAGETDAIDPSLELPGLGTVGGKSVLSMLASATRAAAGRGE